MSRERFALFFEISEIFFQKKAKPAPKTLEGGSTRGVKRPTIRKAHPSTRVKNIETNRISTMDQVTDGQSRVVKPKIAIFIYV